MNIDWSKAPEGATHFDAADNRINSFMKLDGGSWFFWPPNSSEPVWTFWKRDTVDVEAMIPRPKSTAWNGEGLPPVGTDVEWIGNRGGYWVRARIIAENEGSVVIQNHKGEKYKPGAFEIKAYALTKFRPIRTPGQIAAEERSDEVRKMMALNPDENPNQSLTKWLCEALYDAGYRKQVSP